MEKEKILEAIGKMSALELSELVKALEEKFGVSASVPMMAVGATPAASAEEAGAKEEKTSFTVELKSVGAQKIQVIKALRELTNVGLKEAKDIADAAPKVIKEGVSKEEAAEIKAKLEDAGATVEIR